MRHIVGVGAGHVLWDGYTEAVEVVPPIGRQGAVGGVEVHGLVWEEAMPLLVNEAFLHQFAAVEPPIVWQEIGVIGRSPL